MITTNEMYSNTACCMQVELSVLVVVQIQMLLLATVVL